MKILFILAVNLLSIASVGQAQVAAGGPFVLEQSVFGAGGASSGGQFAITGTTGQPVAGIRSAASTYYLHSGFWNAAPLAPTAATVTIGGRVTTATGQGITGVRVTLTEQNGSFRTALTGPLGYYGFFEIDVGQTVIMTVSAKRFRFSQPTLVLPVTDGLGEIGFIAMQ